MDDFDLGPLLGRVRAFEKEAHAILGRHEASRSRVVILGEAYAKLGKLSVKQDDMLRQALRCVEHGLFRAAHVMAWAGFMDFLFDLLSSDGLAKVRAERPAWAGKDIHEMAEFVPERQFVEVARPVGIASKNEVKQMVSLLDRRNECAHPSAYYPDLNITLGYLAEVFQMIGLLKGRTIGP